MSTRGAVRQSLLGYMAAMGIKGPVPGGGTPRGPRPVTKEAAKPTPKETREWPVAVALPPAEPEPPAILEAVLDTTTDTDTAMTIGFMRGVLSVVAVMEDKRAVSVAARKALDLWERTS